MAIRNWVLIGVALALGGAVIPAIHRDATPRTSAAASAASARIPLPGVVPNPGPPPVIRD
ncbi:hypothetical protein [Virgisporangium aurantiacum]|uniref:hypothetical protein n=1 Tax=Virgisporangium aurantiacum TaxID=175570 RepID=UPI00194EAA84|nr:hypothetical protein [Virgisporangium aurantiacum]